MANLAPDSFGDSTDVRPIDIVDRTCLESASAIRKGDEEKALGGVDELGVFLAKAISYGRPRVMLAAARSLGAIYNTSPGPSTSVRVRLAGALIAGGGLGVWLADWRAVRAIASLRVSPEDQSEPFLLPHARLYGARSPKFGRLVAPILNAGIEFAHDNSAARPPLGGDDSQTTDCICQFSAAACLVHIQLGADSVFPEFKVFTSQRSDPLFELVVSDNAVRAELLPGIGEDGLAATLATIASTHHEAFSWRGYEGRQTKKFLAGKSRA